MVGEILKKIIIHAGMHKTGSTSLQQYVRRNAQTLRSKNVYVPASGKIPWGDNGVFLGSTIGGLHAVPKGVQEGNLEPLKAVLSDFEQSGCTTAFLSSEGFDSLTEEDIRTLKYHLGTYDVEVVLVFRHPIAVARSFYCSLGSARWLEPSRFIHRLKQRRRFDFRGLIKDYQSLGAVQIVPFEDSDDSAVAVMKASLGSNVADELVAELGRVPRIRESLPPEAANAFAIVAQAFGLTEAVEKRLYPHWIEWVQESSEEFLRGLPKRRTPYSAEDEEAFLEWWCNQELVPQPDEGCGLTMEIVAHYQTPLKATPIQESDVHRLIDQFLRATFSEKQVLGITEPVGNDASRTGVVAGSERRAYRAQIEDGGGECSVPSMAASDPAQYRGIVVENRALNEKVAALEEEVRGYLRRQNGAVSAAGKGGKDNRSRSSSAQTKQAQSGPTAENVYQSVRYRVGDILASAVSSPGVNTVMAPLHLSRLLVEGLGRKRRRRERRRAAAGRKPA